MSNATEFTRTAQDQVLEGIRQSQNAFVKSVEAWAGAVGPTPHRARRTGTSARTWWAGRCG